MDTFGAKYFLFKRNGALEKGLSFSISSCGFKNCTKTN